MKKYIQKKTSTKRENIVSTTTLASEMRYYYLPAALYYGF